MTEDHISLRASAERLTIYDRFRHSKSKGWAELLTLLQSEKVVARFNFPSINRPQISVPRSHWERVRINQFRTALNLDNDNDGDYLVTPRNFAGEYISWFLENRRLPQDADELSAALRSGAQRPKSTSWKRTWNGSLPTKVSMPPNIRLNVQNRARGFLKIRIGQRF